MITALSLDLLLEHGLQVMLSKELHNIGSVTHSGPNV